MKIISLLGATGSIGTQTLDIIREHPDTFQLGAMSVGKNIDLARKFIHEFKPQLVSVQDYQDCATLNTEFPNTKFTFGHEGLIEVAIYEKAEILVNAVLGSVGLNPTLQAIETGKVIAIANKEYDGHH